MCRRCRIGEVVTIAATAAANQDSKRLLRQPQRISTMESTPPADAEKQLDGSMACASSEIASTWIERLSLELGGTVSSFDELKPILDKEGGAMHCPSLVVPSLD